MKFNFLLKTFIVGVVIILIASCDRDINEIGSGIVGDDHYGLNVQHFDVTAFSQNIGAVQTNNLPVNQLGVYNNPVFGKTAASFVTQVSLATVNPTFINKANIVLDSVFLYVPYFATLQESTTDANGYNTYTLDSIQPKVSAGTALPKIKLSVYESTKSIGGYDPATGLQQLQKYYSDQQGDFDSNHGSILLNDDNRSVYDHTKIDNSQNSEFAFNETEIQFYKKIDVNTPGYTDVASRKAPGMMLNLNKAFFQTKIIDAISSGSGNLFNNSIFQDYFKGLYFKAENAPDSPNQGSLAMMNFSAGYITLVYHDDTSTTDATRVRQELKINLSGNTVNLLNNENTFPGYVPPNTTSGDANLYLKGGNGSMAVIDLFNKKDDYSYDINGVLLQHQPNGIPDELDDLRFPSNGKKWLINEANLTFYIDKSKMGTTAAEPNRIYLYDLNNHRPLVDLYTDYTTSTNTKYNKYIHGGILLDENSVSVKQAAGGRGTKYRIKITNYIRNLVNFGGVGVTKDSTNVRLGLVVTENISNAGINYLKNPFTTSSSSNTITTKYFPIMSVVNPLGTILYGSNASVPDDKRLKLEIYYTKPD